MSKSFLGCFASLICAVPLVSGCGGDSSDVGTVKADGVVTLDGSPVEGATVTFAPKAKEGRAATGLTDASGKFSLTTVQAGDGAMPGSYDVVVSKMVGGTSQVTARTQEEYYAEVKKRQGAPGGGEKPGADASAAKNELPEKYSVKERSGLTADVAAGAENSFKLDLSSK
ncbi:MAG: carboxypeptidase-like regulatory domain-containing protein [Thermoguttaceae bacterium]